MKKKKANIDAILENVMVFIWGAIMALGILCLMCDCGSLIEFFSE